jgi:hypothetical protein
LIEQICGRKSAAEKSRQKKYGKKSVQKNRNSITAAAESRQLMVFGLWRVWCISGGILLVILVILLRVVLVIDLGE